MFILLACGVAGYLSADGTTKRIGSLFYSYRLMVIKAGSFTGRQFLRAPFTAGTLHQTGFERFNGWISRLGNLDAVSHDAMIDKVVSSNLTDTDWTRHSSIGYLPEDLLDGK
ncbi:hypothetical protein F4820DRAFT_226718 [Hypoxylon rubiginosum]|uniref:Uncharacterized protein n=1 Tax=Hypoxylon rubiginosum TaxID=110542 RepID=A0ACB9YI94_9PEZI|nr:hypothetical protein F4820DRAFT_226718 [Hypoxylon rubiginosum]